ncbi:hypothetical protein CHCC20335_0077 [Bacillus paralicheniformis]|nr:hypothetical protein CHCC20335_0077 [Bacillus paralicheniformis]
MEAQKAKTRKIEAWEESFSGQTGTSPPLLHTLMVKGG